MVGEFGEVLVLDWGIARLRARTEPPPAATASPAAPVTGHGTVLGTPDYMPPEQARGDRDVTEAADIFSLGAILAAMSDTRKPLRAIAAKAMSIDPAERYPSVVALSTDVSRYLSGLAVDAMQEGLADRLSRFVVRYRLPLALVATYLLVRTILLLFFRT